MTNKVRGEIAMGLYLRIGESSVYILYLVELSLELVYCS